jgi:alpha-L-fucosidase
VTFEGALADMAGATALEVGLEYRSLKGQDANERTLPWIATPFVSRASRGSFSAIVKGLEAGEIFEYRAVVKHPLLSLYGEDKKATLVRK